MTTYRKKLIEVALPLDAINEASTRENYIYKGNPSAVHKWWAQRPLATARAVLFAQLVDDPSAWPDLFPTEDAQEAERQRLFAVIRRLVPWEAGNDEKILNEAQLEIARSWARSCPSPMATRILADNSTPNEVKEYLALELPAVNDPFAGGGTIPLEAQRLGLRAIASDLNPVAVLLNKALVEIPPLYSGKPPVNPESQKRLLDRHVKWTGAQGLADDVRYYGAWMRARAIERVGHLYPEIQVTKQMCKDRPDLKELDGTKAPVIAWLWARTVASPNPALGGVHVPLVSSYWLSTKGEKTAWISPVIHKEKKNYTFEVKMGTPSEPENVYAGTKIKGASFRCILSGVPIEPHHIRDAGKKGELGLRLLAIVTETRRGRVYFSPNQEHEDFAKSVVPSWAPDELLPEKALGFRVQNYGISRWQDLFTSRQLGMLAQLSDLVLEARDRVIIDAREIGMSAGVSERGSDTVAYADAVATYLAFALDKCAEYSNSLVIWYPQEDRPKGLFARHALPMVWDFAEVNVLGNIGGTFLKSTEIVADSLPSFPVCSPGTVLQADAAAPMADFGKVIVSTDPPYYDNVPYANLSDFFYIWLRRTLKTIFPRILSTISTPKDRELVADPFRPSDDEEGRPRGKDGAERFFLRGMTSAMSGVAERAVDFTPITVYYAFKQTETDKENKAASRASTGWEAFLQAMIEAGFVITGTWPVRSERQGRARDIGSNALASSVVLVCRKRDPRSSTVTRADFRRALRAELPGAVQALQHENIAPVDLAQAAIGPGMAIFSRHSKVIEADGLPMTVRSALQLINVALDEHLSAQEGEADADTRFALTWFETNGWSVGNFGDAETLAKARNISVAGIVESGILHSAAGKVRLLKRSELPADWDPRNDTRVPVWEATQHLIRRLEEQGGEEGAAALYYQLGPLADHAHDLAYRLYSVCERKGWAEDARAYNGLVTAWPEISRLAAAEAQTPPTAPGQIGLGLLDTDPPTAKKKSTARKPRKAT